MLRRVKRFALICLLWLVIITGFSGLWTSSAATAAAGTSDPLNGDWSSPYVVKYNTTEADLMVRVGDIDNFGKGWPKGYDPFSGESTDAPYPKVTHQSSDPAGTDQLMVISSFTYPALTGRDDRDDAIADGYTRSNTYRKGANPVVPLKVTFDTKNIPIEGAILQMYINDYQPRKYPGRVKYAVELDGVRAPFIENIINSLNQHGPIGKLISVQLPKEYVKLLEDGSLTITIDDKTTNNPYGDAGAIDFVKLLVNLGTYEKTGTISGTVTDTGAPAKPIAGAKVSAGGIVTAVTDAKGMYTLRDVPAGLVTVEASKEGYITQLGTVDDLVAGGSKTLNFRLPPQPSNNAFLSNLTVAADTLMPLTPGFEKAVAAYRVDLNTNVPSVVLTPTLEDSQATMTVNGVSHQSGAPKVIPVSPGATKVRIVVTAQDGITSRPYEVTIQTPITSFDLSRSLSKSAVKVGETTSIQYTVEPKAFDAKWLAQTSAGDATGIRPFFLLNKQYEYGKQYDIAQELQDLLGKLGNGNDNNGGLALGGNGKNNFRSVMQNGYSGKVTLNQTLTTETSAKTSDILSGLADLASAGVKEITIPLVDASQLPNNLKGRDSITVASFATFSLSSSASKEIKGVFKGSGPLPATFTVNSVVLTEPLPNGIAYMGIDKSWSNQYGNGILTVTLPDITYRLTGDQYRADPLSFGITVRPTATGSYLLHDSVMAYREGNVTITRMFNNLTLQVNAAVPPVTALTVVPDKLTLRIGETRGLQAIITPSDADQSVVWRSGNTAVATVSNNGNVTAVQAGNAAITASTPDGKFSASSVVTVVDNKPTVTLRANNGWDALYPEKAIVTAEVTDFAESFPMALDVKVQGKSLAEGRITKLSETDPVYGRKTEVYTFEVVGAKKNGNEVGEVYFVGPVSLAVTATNVRRTSSDPQEKVLTFNPVTAFTATLTRDNATAQGTGTLRADPITPVLDSAEFFWTPKVPNGEITKDTKWKPFNQKTVATQVPLTAGGQTHLVVAMVQDFNGNGKHFDEQGRPEMNEIVTRDVKVGGIAPEFTLEKGIMHSDFAKIVVTPDINTVDNTTEWYFSIGSGEWQTFTIKHEGDQYKGEFAAIYQKDRDTTIVTVKAVTPLNGDLTSGISTTKTIELTPPKKGGGGDGGDGGDYAGSSELYIRVDGSSLENRAVKVDIGYSFEGDKDLQVVEARYVIVDADASVDKALSSAGKSFGDKSLKGKIVQYLKTSTGTSTKFKIMVVVKVNILHSLTREVIDTIEKTEQSTVTIKAKNNMN